jgi:hypothetical protein
MLAIRGLRDGVVNVVNCGNYFVGEEDGPGIGCERGVVICGIAEGVPTGFPCAGIEVLGLVAALAGVEALFLVAIARGK